jgi:ubiquinone/menaquinone biosynthesis C-methylase UbiE
VPDLDRETERVRRIYDRARYTARPGHDEGCRWIGTHASGEVLEVGIGRGRTLGYYRRDVTLTGLELSDVAVDTALERARQLGVKATIRQGDAARLPYPNDSFDTVVFCYALCTIPDDRRAVAEAVRVLRPGGLLIALEHVRSPHLLIRGLEHLFEPLESRRMGDHLLREPLEHVLAEGLEVEILERRWLGLIERLAARKPDTEALEEAV